MDLDKQPLDYLLLWKIFTIMHDAKTRDSSKHKVIEKTA